MQEVYKEKHGLKGVKNKSQRQKKLLTEVSFTSGRKQCVLQLFTAEHGVGNVCQWMPYAMHICEKFRT